MKWIAGLGQRFGNLFSGRDHSNTGRQQRERAIRFGLRRVLGHSPEKAEIQAVLEQQRAIGNLQRQLAVPGGGRDLHYDGLSHLEPLKQAKRGYLIVSIQDFLTEILQNRIRTPGARTVANVIFQAHDDPSAHGSVLERGHGLAFQLPFFPMEDSAEALLCPFFGEITAVSVKPAAFAVRTGAPIFPVWCRIDDQGQLCLEIAPAIEGQHHTDRSLTLALLEHFENRIRTSPAEMDWGADCWYPPVRRLLPSRYPWLLELPADPAQARVKPYRLLVRVPDSVREACLAIPAVRALKRGRADVHLTVLATENMHPFWNLLEECDACVDLEAEGDAESAYDLGIVLNWDDRSLDELKQYSVIRTIGMETLPSADQLEESLTMPRRLGPPEHRHRTYLRVAHRLGAEVINDPGLRVPMATPPQRQKQQKPAPAGGFRRRQPQGKSSRKKKQAAASARPTTPIIGIAPDSNDGPTYAWPAERFQEVIRQWNGQAPCTWRIFLEPDTDREPWESLRSELPEDAITLCEASAAVQDRLQELADCTLVLANDNDPLHLAATVWGIPTVAIYGPSDPIQTAPVSTDALIVRRHVECTPCFLEECPMDHRCLNEISVNEVLGALQVALPEAE